MTWFEDLFDEFNKRGEAMFAFSQRQVEEQGVPWETLQKEWCSWGEGLLLKRSAREEFERRFQAAFEADQATLPVVRVRYVGTTGWTEYPTFCDEDGRRLVDIHYEDPGTAVELHTVTSEGEPIRGLRARIEYVTPETAPAQD